MKLKYFELDMPYVENQEAIQELMHSASLAYEQARKEDYSQNWKCRRREFIYESKCMTSMFERLFKPVTTKDCWKIIIECVDKVSSSRIINLLGVYTLQVQFDFCKYYCLTHFEKKKMILSTLVEGLNLVFKELSIPCSLIENVVHEIENNNYENNWVWKKKKIKSTMFSIQVEHHIDKVDLFWLIENKYSRIRDLIKTCFAHEMDYGQYLGKLEIDDFFLYLLDKNNEIVSKVSIESDSN